MTTVDDDEHASAGGVLGRAVLFGRARGRRRACRACCRTGCRCCGTRSTRCRFPHGSRDNYLLKPLSGMNFCIIPMGAMILALPFIIFRGAAERRLRPLLFFWYLTAILGLGGTTPVGKLLLGRAFQVLTFERFTFWATLMALPFVGLLAFEMIARWSRKAVVALAVLAVLHLLDVGGVDDDPPHLQLAVLSRPGDRVPEQRRSRKVPLHHAGLRKPVREGLDLCQRRQRGWRLQLCPPAAGDDGVRRRPALQLEVLRHRRAWKRCVLC